MESYEYTRVNNFISRSNESILVERIETNPSVGSISKWFFKIFDIINLITILLLITTVMCRFVPSRITHIRGFRIGSSLATDINNSFGDTLIQICGYFLCFNILTLITMVSSEISPSK
ncbi:hypothetical protein RF11_04193 [Thelohanellus kitauei]|uniref:Uncharacterized protein n=1 Tax=Thelohanellus kitauei TaxID=669202 RepID=A0A0C2JZM0_THEKT|nr:hypothetical protein RF11_04193 [Thelohanellus kitauei]